MPAPSCVVCALAVTANVPARASLRSTSLSVFAYYLPFDGLPKHGKGTTAQRSRNRLSYPGGSLIGAVAVARMMTKKVLRGRRTTMRVTFAYDPNRPLAVRLFCQLNLGFRSATMTQSPLALLANRWRLNSTKMPKRKLDRPLLALNCQIPLNCCLAQRGFDCSPPHVCRADDDDDDVVQ
jgi:hypothetical protein